jgi:C-terminal processing protease CtpA/Prc
MISVPVHRYQPVLRFFPLTANIEARFHDDIMDTKRRLESEPGSYHPYQFDLIDSLSTAVVTVRDFIGYPKGKFERFLEASFTTVQEKNITNLIVDLRGNDGGDPAYAAAVLSYLVSREIIYFKQSVYGYKPLKRPVRLSPLSFRGKLFVLMDGGCFSTTGHLLSLLKFHKFGVLVGEESGGSYRCYGCPKSYTLANTGINLDCQRCVFDTDVAGFAANQGVLPDIEAKPAIEDLAMGRDTVKQFTLDLIESKHSSIQ